MAKQPHKKTDLNISLDTSLNGLTADNIEIPDWFYNRMQTGTDSIDFLFGGTELRGWVNGTTMSISAAKGMGKTTGLLQILEAYHLKGYKVAYYSSEQTVYQLAFTAKRTNASHVKLSSFNYIEDALEHAKAEKYDIVIFDSLQKFQSKDGKGKDQSTYINSMIRRYSQEHGVATGVVLHRTKTGKTKGDSSIEHDVDINLEIIKADPQLYPDSTRIWVVTKNRFGEDLFVALTMTNRGFNWIEPVSISNAIRLPDKDKKTDARTAKKNGIKETILNYISDEGCVSVQFLLKNIDELEGNNLKARNILKDLVMDGTLVQSGRGVTATWEMSEKTEAEFIKDGEDE